MTVSVCSGVIVAYSILSVMGPWNKMIFSLPASTLYMVGAHAQVHWVHSMYC